VFVLKLDTLKVLSAFGGMNKGDIFPVNNNAIVRGTNRKVTVCRTVSWEVVIVNSVIIDRENISLAHSSKGNGKDTKFGLIEEKRSFPSTYNCLGL
jgi:hypothetical protein